MEINCPPNYRKIYSDILDMKYTHMKERCSHILSKERLTHLDVIKLNSLIFGSITPDAKDFNQRFRSYSKEDIFVILDYQKKHKLNNVQTARHFKLSRNSITKWKKLFI